MNKWVIILYCCVSSSLGFAAQIIDKIVAVVNDEVIVRSALDQQIGMIKQELSRQKIQLPPPEEFEKQVLDNMILTHLQLQLAKSTGIDIEESSLNETLRNIAAQNNMNLETFRQTIEKDKYSYERYREDIRNQLIIKRLQQRQVVNRITVTPQEIDNFLANQHQQGQGEIEYHLLHILIATPEAASPEQIEMKQKQANEVVQKLKAGADFQATAVAVSNAPKALEGGDLGWLKEGELPSLFQDVVNKMSVGEMSQPLRNASGFHIIKLIDQRSHQKNLVTQTQVQHILIKTSELVSDFEAKSHLEALKDRIDTGEDFAQLAKTNSEDATSSAKGGLLGWVSPGEIDPEFDQVINKLPKNQTSAPFKSRYGWHIVQVLDRRTYDNTDQALRTQAAQQIQQRKIEEELQSWLRQLRDEAYVENRLLQE